MDGQMDLQTDRHMDRQTDIDTDIDTGTDMLPGIDIFNYLMHLIKTKLSLLW